MGYELFLWTRNDVQDYGIRVRPGRLQSEAARELVAFIANTTAKLAEENQKGGPTCATYCLPLGTDIMFLQVRRSQRTEPQSGSQVWEAAGALASRAEAEHLGRDLSRLWESGAIWRQVQEYYRGNQLDGPPKSPLCELQPSAYAEPTPREELVTLLWRAWRDRQVRTGEQLRIPFTLEGEQWVQEMLRACGANAPAIAFDPWGEWPRNAESRPAVVGEAGTLRPRVERAGRVEQAGTGKPADANSEARHPGVSPERKAVASEQRGETASPAGAAREAGVARQVEGSKRSRVVAKAEKTSSQAGAESVLLAPFRLVGWMLSLGRESREERERGGGERNDESEDSGSAGRASGSK